MCSDRLFPHLGLIAETDQRSACSGLIASQPGLDGADHPAKCIIGVVDAPDRILFCQPGHFCPPPMRVLRRSLPGSQVRINRLWVRDQPGRKNAHNLPEHARFSPGQQHLGLAHAAGFSGGQQDGSDFSGHYS